jgi:hypothetical protein
VRGSHRAFKSIEFAEAAPHPIPLPARAGRGRKDGRNGGGDLYYTDGEVWILRLVADCRKESGPVATLPSPPATELRDQIWHAIEASLPK